MIAVHHWLMPSLHVFIAGARRAAGAAVGALGLLVSRLLGGLPSPAAGRRGLVVVPSGWLMIELVRSWEGLGGPWGLLGASQWEVSPALRLASVGGVWLVSLLVVAVNTAVAAADRGAAAPGRPAVGGGVVCALTAAAVWMWAPQPEQSGAARIAVVQPGVVDGRTASSAASPAARS